MASVRKKFDKIDFAFAKKMFKPYNLIPHFIRKNSYSYFFYCYFHKNYLDIAKKVTSWSCPKLGFKLNIPLFLKENKLLAFIVIAY